MGRTLVLDIGGTKIAAGLVGAEGELLHQNREPTPHSGDPDVVWAAAERTIAAALSAAGGTVTELPGPAPVVRKVKKASRKKPAGG